MLLIWGARASRAPCSASRQTQVPKTAATGLFNPLWTGQGKSVEPIRKRSHSRAAPRPSLKAQTTRLWPRRASPAANTPRMFVVYFWCSALTLERASRSTANCSSSGCSGPRKPIAKSTSCAGRTLIRAGHFRRHELPFVVALPFDLHGMDFLDAAGVVADKFFGGCQINARVPAEFGRGLLLAVIEPVDLGPLRPGIVLGAGSWADAAGFPVAPGFCSRGATRCRRNPSRCRRRR